MTTKAQMLARRYSRPVLTLEIAGLGDGADHWRLCTRIPAYGSSAEYKDWLASWPELLSQSANPLGGIVSAGQVSVEILDYDDQMTAKLAVNARPTVFLSSAATAASATMTFTSSVTVGSDLHIETESIRVGSLVAGTTYNVTRAHFGTKAYAHRAGTPVYAVPPFILGRKCILRLGFDDAGYSQAEEDSGEIATVYVSRLHFAEGLNNIAVTADSQLRQLDRMLLQRQWLGSVDTAYGGARALHLKSSDDGREPYIVKHFNDAAYISVGGEIIRIDVSIAEAQRSFNITRRRVAGTSTTDDLSGTACAQVYIADKSEDLSSFRYQAPGTETTSHLTGAWISESHPIPIILALMVSSSDRTLAVDYADNYTSSKGNFACLPPGVGAGVDAGRIDFDSAFDVWSRISDYRLDGFILGEPTTARDVIDRIARLCGIEIKTVGTQIRFDLMRTPLEGETGQQWDDDVILTDEIQKGIERPRIEVEIDSTFLVGAVVFEVTAASGREVKLVFTDSDFPTVLGETGSDPEHAARRIEIDARGMVLVDEQGVAPFWLERRALGLLAHFRRPLMRLRLWTDLSTLDSSAGDTVLVSHRQLPDLAAGTRGWTDERVRLLNRELAIEPGAVEIMWDGLKHPKGRYGRVCPSARISGAPTGDTAPVSANRYTDPEAAGGLPVEDEDAFTVGDRVHLVNLDGSIVSTTPAYQTINSIGTNAITLDGNFGGATEFTTGTILEYVDRDDMVAQQYESFVTMSDDATRTPGSASEDAWQYVEA